MIAYLKTKKEFEKDIDTGNIDLIIAEIVGSKPKEMESWKNSLEQMGMVLAKSKMPDEVSIAIEFQIPKEYKRVDFIIAGLDQNKRETVILVELKQWTTVELTNNDWEVKTPLGKGLHNTKHPSYQVWEYVKLLEGFNEVVDTDKINLIPCAYLHNYINDNNISNNKYSEYIKHAPLFFKEDRIEFRTYLDSIIKYPSPSDILVRVDNSVIKPTKKLSDNILSMLQGNKEFIMIGKQKDVYTKLIDTISTFNIGKKSTQRETIIIRGGPGTGKSVLAINLLVDSIKLGLNSRYITANAAPRDVYATKLTSAFKKTEINSLFTGSGGYLKSNDFDYDLLIVDEAHRLINKNSVKRYQGESQIEDIIKASQFSIFFLDENQIVSFADEGTEKEILDKANVYKSNITILDLESQFRCNGSNNYLDWLDYILDINDKNEVILDKSIYDFRIFDNPTELHNNIEIKNKKNNSARTVAGYCWDWNSKKEDVMDIIIHKYNFAKKWNLADDMLWIINQDSVNEIGCIHTSQGLEVDYIGVIVGKDIMYSNNSISTHPEERAKLDRTNGTLRGYKGRLDKAKKENDTNEILSIETKVDKIIKNTYKTLMTRGMKGCYVYFEDEELMNYFKKNTKAKREK